jgi:hypothetical protein
MGTRMPLGTFMMMVSGFFAAACSMVDVASAEPGSMAMVSTSTPFFLPHSFGPSQAQLPRLGMFGMMQTIFLDLYFCAAYIAAMVADTRGPAFTGT